MKKEDIKKVFKKNILKTSVSWMYHCYLLELKITMKDGSEINMLYNENEKQYIDFSDDDYIGFGGLLINPYENIKDIEVKFA